MRTALAAALENGEIFELYQPQMSVDGARVAAAEALLRWRRPGVGLVMPDDFIPCAENHELIEPLERFALERACRAAADWPGVPVSVNVSAARFGREDLVGDILDVARDAGLPLDRLEIEVTEHAPFPDMDAAARIISDLRAQGVKTALDDLGTGYATAAVMAQLPFDRVKLSKVVLDRCEGEEGARELAALVDQARGLGLGVTAEGVETGPQLEFLRQCGCDRIQGFLFARPMTGPELGAFARHHLVG